MNATKSATKLNLNHSLGKHDSLENLPMLTKKKFKRKNNKYTGHLSFSGGRLAPIDKQPVRQSLEDIKRENLLSNNGNPH